MKGRKPLPTELKILTGNPGKRPLNENEPKPDVAIPEPPEFLSEIALEEWHRLVPELEKLGLISHLSRATIASYCQAFSRWQEAEEHLREEAYVLMGEKGGVYQNPWLAIANKAMEQLLKIGAEFGMTPSSQSRVTTSTLNKPAGSPLTLFARSKQA
jgi:P27 family predicted phage terminase small subunit